MGKRAARKPERQSRASKEADRGSSNEVVRTEKTSTTAKAAPPWKWYCFKDNRGNDVVNDWLRKLSGNARGRFARARDQLRDQPKQNWSKPNPASNVGNHIYVIRFKDETSMQHRVFGHFHDPANGFVMTLTGYEKDDVYYPTTYQRDGIGNKSICDQHFATRACSCFSPDTGSGSASGTASHQKSGAGAERPTGVERSGVQGGLPRGFH